MVRQMHQYALLTKHTQTALFLYSENHVGETEYGIQSDMVVIMPVSLETGTFRKKLLR